MANFYHDYWNTSPHYASVDLSDPPRHSIRNDSCVKCSPQRTLPCRIITERMKTYLNLRKRKLKNNLERVIPTRTLYIMLPIQLSRTWRNQRPLRSRHFYLGRYFILTLHTCVEIFQPNRRLRPNISRSMTFNTLHICAESHRQKRTFDNSTLPKSCFFLGSCQLFK